MTNTARLSIPLMLYYCKYVWSFVEITGTKSLRDEGTPHSPLNLGRFRWGASPWWVRVGRVSFCSQLPPSPESPSPCSHSVVPGVLWVQRSAEQLSQPFGRWERTGWCVVPEALGTLCFWPTWAASISPEKAPPRTSQPLPGVPVFTACAFCCRSLLGKVSSGLGWVWLLGDARSRQHANVTFATEGNRALVLSRTFADLAFLRGNAPKLSYPWILERCFQASDPTKVGLTGSLLRGPRYVSPWCTTSSLLAMEMGTGTNAVLAPDDFLFAATEKLLCPLTTLCLCSPCKEVCSHLWSGCSKCPI